MKKRILAGILGAFLLFGVAGVSHAALVNIGTATYNSSVYNLIYDADGPLGPITWLDYTHEQQTWESQIVWAATLGDKLAVTLEPGFTTDISWLAGWRLPSAGENPKYGYNQTTSEMGHLFYEENVLEFNYLLASWYWSGTEYADDPDDAWFFFMDNGFQFHGSKSNDLHGLAVRSGQISAVPVPGAIWLLGSGLTGLIILNRRKTRNRV